MPGFGKNPRMGKRGTTPTTTTTTTTSSSCSSYVSTITMVVFVAFCLLGVYMLMSSSIIPSQATTSTNHHHTRFAVSFSSTDRLPSRFVLRDPSRSLEEDTKGDLPDDAVKSNSEQASEEDSGQEDQEKDSNNSAGTEENSRSETESSEESSIDQQQQQEEEETRPREEEKQQGQGQEQVGEHEESNQQQQEIQENREEESGVNGEDQQPSEDNSNGETDDSQQRSGENKIQSEEQQLSDGQSNEEQQQNSNEEQQEQQSDGQSNDELQQNSNEEQTQMGTNSEDNQQESHQQQQGERENDENQQQSHTEFDGNHNQIQQETDEGMGQSQPQSEDHTEEGGGISSQSQIEHDTDGTSEDHQQQEEPSQQQQTEEESNTGGNGEGQQTDPNVSDSLPDESQSEVSNDSKSKKRMWATQADQSENEKERRKGEESLQTNGGGGEGGSGGTGGILHGYEWELCNCPAGPDYIPCLDNEKAIKQLHSFKHFEHRERHCPEESPTCLVPLPKGYRRSIEWPKSRDRIWYNNVPHTKLAEVKGHQNWVKVTGDYLTFPGGGTQFIHGALHYIDFIQQSVQAIAWGKHTRVILDVGCGVASFGGYLFERDVLTMSFAPKDEHEAQVQFALERGIPAISAVMGSQRLPFPSRVFDVVHCARCRVPWHANGGALLLELNRVLRPGGFFVWSATPVYQKLTEDVEIWKAMTSLTKSMCWDLYTIKKDRLNSVGAAIYRKPISNECYDNRKHHSPPMCKEDDDPNAAWYVPLQSCMHRVPVDPSERGSQWPEEWPRRLQVPPYWLNSSQMGVYGRPAPDDFTTDYEHWKRVVTKSYLSGFGINWAKVRNVMDMRAVYGGFAAALKDMKVWVMNVVNIDDPDTLPIIYERGFFGMYHDWCESFSTYPRTYDLLHADHLFSQLRKRCKIVPVMAEVDRIVRPGGKLIVRDESGVVSEVENILKSLHWEIRLTFSKDQEGILCAEKSDWRPKKFSASS